MNKSNQNGLKILSCGSGMQSSALALMSCENAVHSNTYPLVPVYDAIIFCDLGNEPEWVYSQTKFIAQECEKVDIDFYILESPLYKDLIEKYGKKRVVSVPYWKINEDGKKSKMPRNCTLDYKINLIAKFVRWNLLGYKKGQHLLTKDIKSHEMHIGFSYEERHRCRENPLKLFVNKFPLVDMRLERKDNYAYIKDVWGLRQKQVPVIYVHFIETTFSYTSNSIIRLIMIPLLNLMRYSKKKQRIQKLKVKYIYQDHGKESKIFLL